MGVGKQVLRVSKFVGFLLLLSCGGEQSTVSLSTGRFNVVLIVIDTLRADHLSCNGYHRETSPHIDEFARKNIHFRNVSTTSPTTPPAMAAIMTGRYPYYENEVMNYPARQHGMDRFQPIKETVALSSSLDMLAEILQRNGYYTGGFITNPFVKKDFNFDQGFDTYKQLFGGGPKTYGNGELVSSRGIDWIDGLERDKPFFAYLHYMDVHGPYLPPPEYASLFPSPRLEGKTDLEAYKIWDFEQDLLHAEPETLKAQMMASYDAGIVYEDECVQQVLEYLEKNGFMNDTIVVIVSDHGEEFLEHGGTSHKGKLYEEHIRVPMFFAIPGVGHAEIHEPVQNFNLMPTVLDYCGIEDFDHDLDAASLRPLIDGHVESLDLPIFSTCRNQFGTKRSYRKDGHKLISHVDSPGQSELFDVESDALERENLYAQLAETAADLLVGIDRVTGKIEQEIWIYKPLFRLVLSQDRESGFEAAEMIEGTMRLSDVGIVVKPVDRRARMTLPRAYFGSSIMPIVRIDISTVQEARLNIGYKKLRDAGTLADGNVSQNLAGGRTRLYVPLQEDGLMGPLEITVSGSDDEITIRSIEVLAIREKPPATLLIDMMTRKLPGSDWNPGEMPERGDEAVEINQETMEQLRALGYMR